MRNQRGRILCSHSGQSDEQYSARSIRHCLSAWYVCFVGNVVGLPLCAFVAYLPSSNAIAMSLMGLGMFLICVVVLRYSPFRFTISATGALGVPAIYPQTIPYQPFYQYYSVPMVSFDLGSMYFLYCVTCLWYFSSISSGVHVTLQSTLPLSTRSQRWHPCLILSRSMCRTRSRMFRPSGLRTIKVMYSIVTISPSFIKHSPLLLPPLPSIGLLLFVCVSMCAERCTRHHLWLQRVPSVRRLRQVETYTNTCRTGIA